MKRQSGFTSFKMLNQYKEPWQEKEGCWMVTRKNETTSYTKIEEPAHAEVEYALIDSYDIIVKRIMDFRANTKSWSASDLALDTIKGLRILINSRQKI